MIATREQDFAQHGLLDWTRGMARNDIARKEVSKGA